MASSTTRNTPRYKLQVIKCI